MELAEFYKYLEYEKRYSPNTLISYQNDLQQFAGFISSEYESKPSTASSSQIRSWLSDLMARGISPKSVNRKISSLKSFYRFLESNNKISVNPMQKVTSPKTGKKLPVFVSEEKMQMLFDEIEFEEDFPGVRNRLILEMFYATGMRLAELISLKHKDVDIASAQIKVKGKGNKERVIPMLIPLVNTYKKYLSLKQNIFGYNYTDDVFVTDEGKKIYRKFAYRVVNFYLSTHTTVGKRSPHVLRHSFATHMLNQGADINAIKELLGHSSLSATEVYTHNTVEKLKTVYKQAHPKA
ncbi:MAG: tyrosine-type recombinase/integrase [Bacteroidales bacterium]|nr:tyrosine-type recombinase/integrase [Bacteroidales bacterium]